MQEKIKNIKRKETHTHTHTHKTPEKQLPLLFNLQDEKEFVLGDIND